MSFFTLLFKLKGYKSLYGMRETAYSVLPKYKSIRNSLQDKLNRGADIIEDEDLLDMYLYSYGKMHRFKLVKALFDLLEKVNFNEETIEIIDWGCGQGLGTICLLDCFKYLEIKPKINSITLIDPSSAAINRAYGIIDYLYPELTINIIAKDFDSLTIKDFNDTGAETKKIHIFSNILDVESYDILKFSNLILKVFSWDNYFVCVGPSYNKQRMDRFIQYMEPDYRYRDLYLERGDWVGEWSISLHIFYKNIILDNLPKEQTLWIDNAGSKYSNDWTTLLIGPDKHVVEKMMINTKNFKFDDFRLYKPRLTNEGKKYYFCSFNKDSLLFLPSSIWKHLIEVNRETVWKTLIQGDYIIREARDLEDKWIIIDDEIPLMMISPLKLWLTVVDWDSGEYVIEGDLADVERYSIKPGTKIIKSRAFSGCKYLEDVTIPNSVKIIGNDIFKGCDFLKHIYIPDGTLRKFEFLLFEYKDKLVETIVV